MKLKKVSNPHMIVLGLVAGLLVISLIINNKYPQESEILEYVIVGIVVLSVLSKGFAGLLATLWISLGMLLGRINSTILLTLVYFLILTPLSILKSIFSKQSSSFKLPKDAASAFIVRKHLFSDKDTKHPW